MGRLAGRLVLLFSAPLREGASSERESVPNDTRPQWGRHPGMLWGRGAPGRLHKPRCEGPVVWGVERARGFVRSIILHVTLRREL